MYLLSKRLSFNELKFLFFLVLQAEEKYKESSLDFKHCYASTSSDASFILIGRNVDQWQASIQDMGEDEMADINMRQSQRDKGKIEIMHTFSSEVILIFSFM